MSERVGPAGRTVAANVRLLRGVRGLSLRGLAERVAGAGGSLSADAINKIENGREGGTDRQVRRVDADDLAVLASALDVPLLRLFDAVPECSACHGAPPVGFACLTCGAGTVANEPPGSGGTPKLRRNAVTDDHLRSVATAYRNAFESGEAPTWAVATVFGASHSTAARWVGMARTKGFLGATTPGSRGGELR